MLMSHEKQVSRIIKGTLHLLDYKKPSSQLALNVVKTSLPYVIHKNIYGGYWILNREYKPLGLPPMLGKEGSEVRLEDYQCNLTCTPKLEAKYQDESVFYIGNSLTEISNWRFYLKEMEELTMILEDYWSSVEGLKRKLLGLDRQFIMLDGPLNLGKKGKLE